MLKRFIINNWVKSVCWLTLLTLAGCTSAPTPMQDQTQAQGFKQNGKASYYAAHYHGKTTASGEAFDQNKLTAAHPVLPFGTNVKVTNQANNQSVVVKVNDRGPFVSGRVIDLTKTAFGQIADLNSGVISVTLEVID
ncbi:septal ring lytic transglycosylase RlpA family protein [Catenovulum sp. 2E275]|uniref:septal ring lytic transglycosylase RlpA family protein n=1 Tax=Catenovulum sp. 2E275 TaxID=2980497 RepID=UPI0021D053D7|nr:septal ring lytic transglycosylase RlpA family protein [Catenovulum sp. 2E275]MCU4675379.1 septal ring lytic transglycosylase RlpA family protein [Catenovulum sp. 2E275]